jgi:hypothetical protein
MKASCCLFASSACSLLCICTLSAHWNKSAVLTKEACRELEKPWVRRMHYNMCMALSYWNEAILEATVSKTHLEITNISRANQNLGDISIVVELRQS